MENDIEDQDFKYLEALIQERNEKHSKIIQEIREEHNRTMETMEEIKRMLQGMASPNHEVNPSPYLHAASKGDGIIGSGTSPMNANHCTKLEYPRFDGCDLHAWLYKLEQFFELDHTVELNKVKVASTHLDGKALHWFEAFLKTKEKDKVFSWSEFVIAITNRFGEQLFIDPISELKKLKQVGSVQQYLEEFDMELSRIDLNETQAMSHFLNGLKEGIGMYVRLFNPTTLQSAIALAKVQELVWMKEGRTEPGINNRNDNNEVQSNGAMARTFITTANSANTTKTEGLALTNTRSTYTKPEPLVVLKDGISSGYNIFIDEKQLSGRPVSDCNSGGIYTMYHEAHKFIHPNCMKSVDATQIFEEIPQQEFVPWNTKVGTEFECLEKVNHVSQYVCTQILIFKSSISGWKHELYPDVMPWRPDSLTISLIEGINAAETFEATRAMGAMMYNIPYCPGAPCEIQSSSAVGGPELDAENAVGDVFRKSDIQMKEMREHDIFYSSSPLDLVTEMLDRLRCWQEDQLASLAVIVTICGLNTTFLEVDSGKDHGMETITDNSSNSVIPPTINVSSLGTSAKRYSSVTKFIDGDTRKEVETILPSLDRFLVKHVSRLEGEIQKAKSQNDSQIVANGKGMESLIKKDAIAAPAPTAFTYSGELVKHSSNVELDSEGRFSSQMATDFRLYYLFTRIVKLIIVDCCGEQVPTLSVARTFIHRKLLGKLL